MVKPLIFDRPIRAWQPSPLGATSDRSDAPLLRLKSARAPALPAHLAALRDRLRPAEHATRVLAFGNQIDAHLPGGRPTARPAA